MSSQLRAQHQKNIKNNENQYKSIQIKSKVWFDTASKLQARYKDNKKYKKGRNKETKKEITKERNK